MYQYPMFEYPRLLTARHVLRERGWDVPEAHVVDIWLREAVLNRVFISSDGKELRLLSIGRRNIRSGADFFHARIEYEGRRMQGDIEIHKRVGDWMRHHHDRDARYRNVIVHVVMHREHFVQVRENRLRQIPTIVLEENLSRPLSAVWSSVMSSHDPRALNDIACAERSAAISMNRKWSMIELLAAQRFEKKQHAILTRYRELLSAGTRGTSRSIDRSEVWRQLFYELFVQSLGFGGNRGAMFRLAGMLPLKLFTGDYENHLSLRDRYILLVGAAGLLSREVKEHDPEEAARMVRRWGELKSHFGVTGMDVSHWNYGKTRPQNAPHRRLMTVAAFMPKLLDTEWLRQMLRVCLARRQFDDRMRKQLEALFCLPGGRENTLPGVPAFGEERIHEIIVNCIAPFLAALGNVINRPALKARGIELYFHFPSRAHNSITGRMGKGLELSGDQRSGVQQGMIELHETLCFALRCGDCLIGRQVI